MTIDVVQTDNLFRGAFLPGAVELRADDDAPAGAVMAGHFAVFDTWTEIHSWFEGDFLERIERGAFAKTISENRDNMRVQFDHGYDTFIGSAPLGPIDVLEEDKVGARYEVPLLDTDYNRDRILPMLEGRLMSGEATGSVLGASFRFRVTREEWDEEPGSSDHNPDGIAERTIKEVRLHEFGPVVFGAYPEATSGLRSLTDHYLERTKSLRSAAGTATADPRTSAPPPGTQRQQTGRPTVAAARTTLTSMKGR